MYLKFFFWKDYERYRKQGILIEKTQKGLAGQLSKISHKWLPSTLCGSLLQVREAIELFTYFCFYLYGLVIKMSQETFAQWHIELREENGLFVHHKHPSSFGSYKSLFSKNCSFSDIVPSIPIKQIKLAFCNLTQLCSHTSRQASSRKSFQNKNKYIVASSVLPKSL